MLFVRQIAEIIKSSKKSILLLGPRQTGKSTLIRTLRPEVEINLANEQTYVDHLRDPGLLAAKAARAKTVFVDEVQRIPSMLNSAQAILDADKAKTFFFTGSSARKLRRGQANLLPGRVHSYQMGPLSMAELGPAGDILKLMRVGALPGPYSEENEADARKTLRSYAATYLKEEIQAEALTRNLEGFSRFFDAAAGRSGDFIDFSKIASAAGIERMSARRYFDILVDTLVVNPLEAFAKSTKRRLVQHPKFYFFDVGVWNACLGTFDATPDRAGPLFEHLCLQMILSEAKARDEDIRISAYRTEAGLEVDFVVERGRSVYAIEAKASRTIGGHDLRGLKGFAAYRGKSTKCIVLYLGEHELEKDGIVIAPLGTGISMIYE